MELPGIPSTPTAPEPSAAALGVDSSSRTAPGSAKDASAEPRQTAEFAKTLEKVRSSLVTVQRGDNLTRIAQRALAASAPDATPNAVQLHREALKLARHNGLENPDRIMPGQQIDVSSLPQAAGNTSTAAEPARGMETVQPKTALAPVRPDGLATVSIRSSAPESRNAVAAAAVDMRPSPIVRIDGATASQNGHPLLQQTLARATNLGFIPPQEHRAVQARILDLANKHGFSPDDFARAALMESDGFNPRANNGRCYGIIQFCDGPDRGAASAGYGRNPSQIMNLSVLRQLDLVDRYFDDTRLKEFSTPQRTVGLDDLYLTILTPAARQERRLHAPLPIAGPQAPSLHVMKDSRNPITRNSLLEGLYNNARERLGSIADALRGPGITRVSRVAPNGMPTPRS